MISVLMCSSDGSATVKTDGCLNAYLYLYGRQTDGYFNLGSVAPKKGPNTGLVC